MNQCGAPTVFEIFTGEDKTMSMKVAYEDTSNPLDLSSCTEIVVSLPAKTGQRLLLKLSLNQVAITSPGVLGNFTATISAVNSALLNVGVGQDVVVYFTIGGLVTIVRYFQVLTVLESA